MEIFCFMLGIGYYYTLNPCLLIAGLALFFINRQVQLLIGLGLGFFWAMLHQQLIEPQGIPKQDVLPRVEIQGNIASIPLQQPNKTQFTFALQRINKQPATGLIQIAWYNKIPPLQAGESWKLWVKLKKPRNFYNPGSYDYENMLATRHISRIGYVLSTNNNLIAKAKPSWLKLRETLSQALKKQAPNLETAGIIEALTLNLTNHIQQSQWDLFRRTGTTHLFGISGEHITIIAGLVYWLVYRLWGSIPRLSLYLPAMSIASLVGFLIALLYAFLAGFAPPVQRALVGSFLYTICCLGRQGFTTWQIWRYALLIVLSIEPHAIFMQGFYFSFLAVACILVTQQRWKLQGYKSNLAIQLSCLIGLMPLTIYWFSYGSINGFIANLFAIPLVGFLIIPLALLALLTCTTSLGWIVMKPLAWLVNVLCLLLHWVENLDAMNIIWSMPSLLSVLCFMGGLFFYICLPIKPFKQIALLWFLLPFMPNSPPIPKGEARIRVLDVGQGLSIVVQTQQHVLIYDTGDQFFNGNDLGNMVVLPYLKTVGIKKIDTVVISHPDKDHRGGLGSIQKQLPITELLVNEIEAYHQGKNCHEYPDWEWDGVYFHFFPIRKTFKEKNNNSCILQISSKAGKILFTGDIEKKAEAYLIQHYRHSLASNFLILAHHGSKTSSSYRFLLEVAPLYAIASLGFDNRFHFPHSKTLNSLQFLNIPFYSTDTCGMIELQLPKTGTLTKPRCYR